MSMNNHNLGKLFIFLNVLYTIYLQKNISTISESGALQGAQKIIENSKKDRFLLIAGVIVAWIVAMV